MEPQEMEIIIDKDGQKNITVNGVHGTGCLALTKSLEDAVGVVEEREHTAEYYEQVSVTDEYQRLGSR